MKWQIPPFNTNVAICVQFNQTSKLRGLISQNIPSVQNISCAAKRIQLRSEIAQVPENICVTRSKMGKPTQFCSILIDPLITCGFLQIVIHCEVFMPYGGLKGEGDALVLLLGCLS